MLSKLDKNHQKAVYWVVKASKEMGKPKEEVLATTVAVAQSLHCSCSRLYRTVQLLSLRPGGRMMMNILRRNSWSMLKSSRCTPEKTEATIHFRWGVRVSEALVKGRMDKLEKMLQKVG